MCNQYYAACDANGPISVAIAAENIEIALAAFADVDHQCVVDAAQCDAEDDLGFDGASMSADEFDDAMEERGYTVVYRDHEWRLFGLQQESENADK